jgi:hypothetical protein
MVAQHPHSEDQEAEVEADVMIAIVEAVEIVVGKFLLLFSMNHKINQAFPFQ